MHPSAGVAAPARGVHHSTTDRGHPHAWAWITASGQHLDESLASMNQLSDRARREIDLIREYRTRLIADVVTGKVDVRGLTPDELLSADERIEEGTDDGEMLGDDELELVEEAADE